MNWINAIVQGIMLGGVFAIASRGVSLGRDAEPRPAEVAVFDARMSRQHARVGPGGAS